MCVYECVYVEGTETERQRVGESGRDRVRARVKARERDR